MGPNDMEKELMEAKFHHLTEDELDLYIDQLLDNISRARAEAHLQICRICKGQLQVLREESAALERREVSASDIALAKRILQRERFEKKSSDSTAKETPPRRSLPDMLGECLDQAVAHWRAHFLDLIPEPRGDKEGKEIWQWESEDGKLKCRAVSEDTGDLTVHFSSDESSWEGEKFRFRLGSANRETTLERVSESELYAKIKILRRDRPRDLTDMSLEMI